MSAFRLCLALYVLSMAFAVPAQAMRGEPVPCSVLFGNYAPDGLQRWEQYLAYFAATPPLTRTAWEAEVETMLQLPDADWTPRLGEVFDALRQAWRQKPCTTDKRRPLAKCDTEAAAGVVDMRHFLLLPDDQLGVVLPDSSGKGLNPNLAVLTYGDTAPACNSPCLSHTYGRLEAYRHRVAEKIFRAGGADDPGVREAAFRLADRWSGWARIPVADFGMPGTFRPLRHRDGTTTLYPYHLKNVLADDVIRRWAVTAKHPLRERSVRLILAMATFKRESLGFRGRPVPANHKSGIPFPRSGVEALLSYLDPSLAPDRETEIAVRTELAMWPFADRHDPLAIHEYVPPPPPTKRPPR